MKSFESLASKTTFTMFDNIKKKKNLFFILSNENEENRIPVSIGNVRRKI